MDNNIYIIESPDKKWRAEISARLGANVVKLQYESKDVFLPFVSNKQYNENPFLVGSPMLLPANRTYNGEFEFQGKRCQLPINDSFGVANLHGFLYSVYFDLIEISSNRIILSYQNNGSIYPFIFKITIEYILNNDGFEQNYRIDNIGNADMPFTFALHTTFVEPSNFIVPIDMCQQKDERHIPTGKYVDLSEQEKIYTKGSGSEGLAISGYYRSCGNIAIIGDYKYIVSNNFDHWVLYNGGGKSGYLCVEPQCGAVNGLNIKDGFKILKPKCCEVFVTKMTKNI